VNLYAADADVDGVLHGKFVGLTVAAAPFPIPIKLAGTFELFSLDRRSFCRASAISSRAAIGDAAGASRARSGGEPRGDARPRRRGRADVDDRAARRHP